MLRGTFFLLCVDFQCDVLKYICIYVVMRAYESPTADAS
jgi:hypothetical protein